jgi:hypothetical protein
MLGSLARTATTHQIDVVGHILQILDRVSKAVKVRSDGHSTLACDFGHVFRVIDNLCDCRSRADELG